MLSNNNNSVSNYNNMNSIYTSSLIGKRTTNEDVEIAFTNLSNKNTSKYNAEYAPIDIFIVCDGHGGHAVSKFVCPRLAAAFLTTKSKYPLCKKELTSIYDGIQNQIIEKKIGDYTGCTALVVIKYQTDTGKSYLQVFNTGDSRAVICRNGYAVPLTKDHKPSWPSEKIRIAKHNTKLPKDKQRIIEFYQGDWRIGNLSVSRAFGDVAHFPHVTHLPEISIVPLTSSDDFLVLGCDGLYDKLSNDQVVNFVLDYSTNNLVKTYSVKGFAATKWIGKNIAEALGNFAIQSGSTDNVSVIIVPLKKQ